MAERYFASFGVWSAGVRTTWEDSLSVPCPRPPLACLLQCRMRKPDNHCGAWQTVCIYYRARDGLTHHNMSEQIEYNTAKETAETKEGRDVTAKCHNSKCRQCACRPSALLFFPQGQIQAKHLLARIALQHHSTQQFPSGALVRRTPFQRRQKSVQKESNGRRGGSKKRGK